MMLAGNLDLNKGMKSTGNGKTCKNENIIFVS
jgi:hypothetical protein